jgi:hypothetical protein
MMLLRRLVRRGRAAPRKVRAAAGKVARGFRRTGIRVKAYKRLMEKEAEWEVPLHQRQPRWWRHGFLSRSAVLYDLDHNDPADYVSDAQRYIGTRRMVHPRLQDVINNKLTTHLLLQRLDVQTAALEGVYWRGGVHLFPGEDRKALAEYLSGLPVDKRVFFKPLGGAEGKNLFSIRRTPDGFRMNGTDVRLAAARAAIELDKRPMIVEAGVEQHAAQRALFAETTNTIRLLTMLDMTDRSPFIVLAVQRIGARSSGPVDNWSQGGLSARIDLDTGRLGRATRLPERDGLQWFSGHPDTGAPIEGQLVPHWELVKETVLRAARAISFLEYVGWDIIVTEDGPVVLEANINSGMNVLQVHKPLLADPRARAYLAKRGVVPPRPGEAIAAGAGGLDELEDVGAADETPEL